MSETRLTSKEMCLRFDVTPRTLRHYEYIELLAPQREGRRRIYGAREVARLTLILRGRAFGIPLEEIRKWLLLYDRSNPVPQYKAAIKLLDNRIAQQEKDLEVIRKKIGKMNELRASIQAEISVDSQP